MIREQGMAGELSPDKLYFWDGARWASALSPDGLWRWDGHTWRPAASSRRASNLVPIAAVVVIASLVVTTFGVYEVAHWALARTQAALRQAGVGVVCSESGARAGRPLAEHDILCGRRLGTSYYRADCDAPGTPNGGEFFDAAGGGDWQSIQVSSDGSGCRLDAQPDHETMFSTMDPQRPSSTLIVDFTAAGWAGGAGVEVACSNQGCIDFALYGDGYYSLDHGNGSGKFDNITHGHLGAFGDTVPETGTAYRLIMRVAGRTVDVFLNGSEVAHGSAAIEPNDGYATFFADGRDTTSGESVVLHRMFLFETLASS